MTNNALIRNTAALFLTTMASLITATTALLPFAITATMTQHPINSLAAWAGTAFSLAVAIITAKKLYPYFYRQASL